MTSQFHLQDQLGASVTATTNSETTNANSANKQEKALDTQAGAGSVSVPALEPSDARQLEIEEAKKFCNISEGKGF
jgi:hypothetical protein